MNSIWSDALGKSSFPILQGSICTDVLIIGGGMAGLLCAYKLRGSGIDCVLLEAGQICSGITQNTTAKITTQHGLIYHKLIEQVGVEKAKLYFQSQEKACRELKSLCEALDCDYETRDAYVYTLRNRDKIKKEAEALERIGNNAELTQSTELPFPVLSALKIKHQGQFHPLRFAVELARELPIYENTRVLRVKGHKAFTDRGEIVFRKVIVATHFPFINRYGMYFLKQYQHRSYVLALKGAQVLNGMYVDEDQKGLSFRNYKNLLLLGGAAHRTGKQARGWTDLEAFAAKHYPSAKIVGRWATQDCMTLDGIPYIGQYSLFTPNMYVATGFQKWGMSSSMVAAMLLGDLIQGKENDYAALYSPQRPMAMKQLGKNAGSSAMNLLKPTRPRCPHMGCALSYNHWEHSWDCPCHGSRFEENGKLLDNPATKDKYL